MRSLIWKEWRETRWIAIGFLVICLLTSVCWKVTRPGDEHGWHASIWSLLAVVLGARGFASEKQTTAMEFLAAQPLRKTHLWALKAAWGFAVILIVVAISGIFDYLLMRADPFYVALHLMAAPLSWAFLALLAVYAVALLSSSICDKTVVAIGFAVIIWAVVFCIIALIDRFHPFFYQFFNEPWGFPLGALWFSLVFLAGSFLIVAWREIWPNYPTAVKSGVAGAGIGTVIVLLILSSANVPPERLTRITQLVASRARVHFSAEVDGKRLPGWEIDIDGENFTKSIDIPLREREQPALGRSDTIYVGGSDRLYVRNIASGGYAGGYLVEKVDRSREPFVRHRRKRAYIFSETGTLSWIGGKDPLCFEEKKDDGKTVLWTVDRDTLEKTCHEELGNLIAASPNAERFIFSGPGEEPPEGKVRLRLVTWKDRTFYPHYADVDPEIVPSLSFVTQDIVRYERAGSTYLTVADHLGEPYREAQVGPQMVPWRVRLLFKVPRNIVARGPEYLRRVAENRGKTALRHTIGYEEPERVIARLTGETREKLPEWFVQEIMHHAKALMLLEEVAAEWRAELPEELFDEAIFLVPGHRQILYLSKRDERRRSWLSRRILCRERSALFLLDIESGESTKILDDIDVTAPAVPKALVAPIMDDHFVFVRDAKTIWTYRDGTLKQIFPPS